MAQRLGSARTIRRSEEHLDCNLGPRAPGGVSREWPGALFGTHPVADALAVQHERARRAALAVRPFPLGVEWPVRHAHGRHAEDGAEVQSEPATAQMVAARGADEQDVGDVSESACGSFEQGALAQSKLAGGVVGRRFPCSDGHVVAARGGCKRAVTSHAIPPGTSCSRTGERPAPHSYAVGDCAGHRQLAHTAFREGEIAAENATGHEAVMGVRAVPRPIYTDPEIAAVGLTETEARYRHGDDVAVGRFPWAANARAVMQNETVGWVKSIHESRYGELLGVVMVGPHVTDLIEAAVVALDAEATVETVADGMTAHPTLSEAFKEAGLVALGRPIHVGPRRRAAMPTQSS